MSDLASPSAVTLQPGSPAPALLLPRAGGGQYDLAARAGQITVVYFFPKADTGTCAKQGEGFTALLPRFAALGAEVVGISKDPLKKHEKFKAKFALGVTLLSDDGATASEDWGVWAEKSMYGKAYMGIERTTFLIGRDGRIAEIWRKVKIDGHMEAVLAAAEALAAKG